MHSADRPVVIGVLGCSDVARRRFLPAAAGARNAVVTLVGTRRPGEAQQALRGFPGIAAVSYDELLADSGVGIVYVSLPNDRHETWTLAALERGKHVICEKPLGLTSASVAAMVRKAEERGLLLYENIMYLHHPQHRMLRDAAAGGRLGRIRILRASFGFTLQPGTGFRGDPRRGGGALHDLGRYPLSACLHYLEGKPGAFAGQALFRGGLNVAVQASAATDRDEMFSFSIGFEQHYENRIELIGELGSARLERSFTIPPGFANGISLTIGDRREVLPVPAADQFTAMIEAVAALVRSGDRAAYRKVHERQLCLALMAEAVLDGCMTVDCGGRPG